MLQGRLFVAHVAILLSALMFLQPLNRSWSRVAWRILTQLCAVSSAYKVMLPLCCLWCELMADAVTVSQQASKH